MNKILIVTFSMGIGGLENMLMNYYRFIDNSSFQLDFVVNKTSEESNNIKELRDKGANIIYIGTPGQLGAKRYVTDLKKIILENGPYTAVHSNNEYHGGLVCLAAKISGVKNRICHSHTTSVNLKRNLYLMPVYKLIIKLFSTVNLACSTKAGDFLFFNNYEVIPNAIDIESYHNVNENSVKVLRQALGINDECKVIGHIGRFSEEKNHVFLIDLLTEYLKISSNVMLILVGDGNLKKDIEIYARQKGVFDKIKFEGFRSNINEYLHVFDFLLLPSLYEGMPVTIIEGQACGVTCLVSKTVTKEVDLGMNLVKFLEINNCRDWIEQLENDSSIKPSKESVIRKFKESNFEIRTVSKRLMSIYTRQVEN